MKRFTGFGRWLADWFGGSRVRSAAVGGLVGILSSLPSARNANADLIRVRSIGGDVGNSSMYLEHHVDGALGIDGRDELWISEAPPGVNPDENWLRAYSNQINIYEGFGEGFEQKRDTRPFSGVNTNQLFPIILDTRYGENEPSPSPITSSNNFVRFELQSPIDESREFYHWSMTLDPTAGASWDDGLPGNTRSGTWDLAATGGQGGTYDLPSYNLMNTQGQYGTLDVLPIPEPSTLLLLIGAGGALAWRRKRMNPRSGRMA